MRDNKKLIWIAVIVFSLLAVVTVYTSINRDTNSKALAVKVQAELDKLGGETKSALASTDRSGNIVNVEPAIGSDAVEVNVSTYFDSPDEGKIIARNIFNVVCANIPEINSLYVTSGQGLESHSIYRSESACK